MSNWFMDPEDPPSEEELKKRVECVQMSHGNGQFLEDKGHAGPDSGCINLECSNCGWSYYHVLY